MINQNILKFFVAVINLSTILMACELNSKKGLLNEATHSTSNNFIDTTEFAIIAFDQLRNYPFDSSCIPTTLASYEIQIIDSLTNQCLIRYNKSLSAEFKHREIDIEENTYKKQVVPVINRKGEKEVWVNYFCRDSNKNWKKDIIMVEDGGNCYFNFKINLSKNTFYDLYVNGEA